MTTQEILQGVHDWTNGKIVYDISAAHPDGQGKPTTYADLAAALDSNNGGGVPQSLQKGGMSIKFVQSSDNKYVQYRLMSNSFSTTVSDWQGVDDEPTAGSDNLVTSDGVSRAVKNRNTTSRFTTLNVQNENKKLSFSDNTFGNLSNPFGISIIFHYEGLHESVNVVLIGKGDYTSNGWAIIKKPNVSGFYFVLNGVEYKITSLTTSGIDFVFSIINDDDNIYVYLFNKKVLSIEKDGVLDNDSYLQLGGNGVTNYTYSKWVCALFWYEKVDIDDCISDLNKIYNGNFSRIDISADFICCEQTLVQKGFVDGKYSLLSPNNVAVTYKDIVKMPGDINILNSFYCFGGKIHKTLSGGTYDSIERDYFTTSFIDVSNFGKIIINKAAFYGHSNVDICTFYNNEKVEIKAVLSKTLTKDGTYDYGSYVDYKNKVIVNIPSEAKYAQVCLGFNGYVEFEERDFEYIKPSVINISKYTDRGFNKVPCIMFEASDYISAYWITKKTWWDDRDGLEVLESDGVNKTITISTEYLTYFTNNVVYNMVYETPNGEQDFMYLFRNTDNGVMHVLSDIVPPIGSLLYSHIHIEADGSNAGELHLSTIAYRVLGEKIVEDSHNIYNAQLTNRCGFYYSGQLQTQQGLLKDINGNGCFYYDGKVIATWTQLFSKKTWGVRENTHFFYTSNQRSVYFKHDAPFKNGFYDIMAVAPRFFANEQNVQQENYPVTLNVYNNNDLIHTQSVCDYRPKRIIVSLNREYSGNHIFNLNKEEVGDVVYSTVNAVISAIPQSDRKLNMIVTAKRRNSDGLTGNRWTTLKFIGDTLEKFTDTSCWETYEFDKVKIEFVGTNSEDSIIAVQRILQYDFSDDYFDMGINSPSLTQNNVGKPSHAGIIGDSWTISADKPVTYEEPIIIYGEDGVRENDSYGSRPLIRGMMEEGCPTDCWGIGTKTAMWAWIHQVRPFVQHTEYTHCVVKFFENDTNTDWYGAMSALVKILQENGIIPIVFAPISGREEKTGYLKAIL